MYVHGQAASPVDMISTVGKNLENQLTILLKHSKKQNKRKQNILPKQFFFTEVMKERRKEVL